MIDLIHWGWNDFFAAQWSGENRALYQPARVIQEEKDCFRVLSENGEHWAQVSGRLRFAAEGDALYPAVGDWVLIDQPDGGDHDRVILHRVLDRRSAFVRKHAGEALAPQVMAANVDVVFIATSLNQDLNPRRLERYLTLAWNSGAVPVILLTKCDLTEEAEDAKASVEAVAPGVDVLAISATAGTGMQALAPYLAEAKTGVLVGSSGVGKSTLINALTGQDCLRTSAIREEDGRGRHTTTSRHLVALPSGGLIIDTPGLREVQLWEGEDGLGSAFEDIESLALRCRFRDCSHAAEPDCAIREAIGRDELDEVRFGNYLKLQRELSYQERKKDKAALSLQKKEWKRVHLAYYRDQRKR